jgi:hypothetical protein
VKETLQCPWDRKRQKFNLKEDVGSVLLTHNGAHDPNCCEWAVEQCPRLPARQFP